MVEIRVEKRKKPVWPWILGLLAIVVVAFILLNNSDVEETKDNVATTVTGQEGGQAAGKAEREMNNLETSSKEATGMACIERLSNFVRENSAKKAQGTNHQYTHDGLKYLSCSLESLIEQNNLEDAGLNEKRRNLKQATEQIQKGTSSANHENEIKNAFKESVNIMDAIQKKSYPELKDKVAEVKNAAKNFEAKTSTLEQKEEIGQFFQKASEAVVAMRDKK